MDGKNPVKTQNPEIRNLEIGDSQQELTEEEAEQVVGGFCKTDYDPYLLRDCC